MLRRRWVAPLDARRAPRVRTRSNSCDGVVTASRAVVLERVVTDCGQQRRYLSVVELHAVTPTAASDAASLASARRPRDFAVPSGIPSSTATSR